MMLLALAILVGSGLCMAAVLKFTRSLGAYTETQKDFGKAVLEAHATSLLLHQHQLRLLEELRGTRVLTRPEDVHEGEPEHEVREVA